MSECSLKVHFQGMHQIHVFTVACICNANECKDMSIWPVREQINKLEQMSDFRTSELCYLFLFVKPIPQ